MPCFGQDTETFADREEEMKLKNNSKWMAELPSELTTRPLNQIAIPGSHDTTTYHSDLSGGLACDVSLPSWLRTILPYIPCGMRYVQHLSQTQDRTLRQQLYMGVRYLDLRLCQRDSELWTLHGLYCLKLTEIFDVIHEFIADNPKEVLFLDFNHFYDMEWEDYHKLCEMVEGFGSKLCPRQSIEKLTLAEMWKNGWQILTFYNQGKMSFRKKYWWPDSCCRSPWANTMDRAFLFKFLTDTLADRATTTFNVTQGILTPDTTWCVEHFWESISNTMKSVRKPLIQWLGGQTIGPKGVNLVITDFVDDEYMNAVLELNKIT